MNPCFVKHGNARVRIGITGEGKIPYHKVTFMSADGHEQFYDAFAGESRFQGVKVLENTWSTGFMTYEDVQALLGKLRG
jgi:hypothetical protein